MWSPLLYRAAAVDHVRIRHSTATMQLLIQFNGELHTYRLCVHLRAIQTKGFSLQQRAWQQSTHRPRTTQWSQLSSWSQWEWLPTWIKPSPSLTHYRNNSCRQHDRRDSDGRRLVNRNSNNITSRPRSRSTERIEMEVVTIDEEREMKKLKRDR